MLTYLYIYRHTPPNPQGLLAVSWHEVGDVIPLLTSGRCLFALGTR